MICYLVSLEFEPH